MRQSLMIGARPRFVAGKTFPRVPLGAGNWKIVVEGVVDSILHLRSSHDNFESLQALVELEGPITLSCVVSVPGTETFISVYAERLDGTP